MIFKKSNILSRYLTKEVLNATAVVTFFLLLIFLSQQMVRLFSYAASGKLAANILLQLMGFEIPYLLVVLLPLGLYLGIVWAYGGLYANNELRIMHACGLSIKRLFMQTAVLIVLLSAVVFFLALWMNPWISSKKTQIILQSSAVNNLINTILPGRFQVSKDGKRVIYIEHLTRNRSQANNLFIADQKIDGLERDSKQWTVVSAARGFQTIENKERFLVAEEGNRYEGMPGENDYKVIHFQQYKIHVPDVPFDAKHLEQEAVPTHQLWQHYHRADYAAELQWRLAFPISALLLAALAVPLSRVKPRQGRYLRLMTAILIYIVYINLLFVARNWVEQKKISIHLGLWWVHLLLFLLVLFAASRGSTMTRDN